MPSLTHCADLVALLAERAESSADLPIYGLLSPGGSAGTVIDCATLFLRARAIAASLQREGIVAGDRVLLPCPTTIEAIVSFWGVVCAGAIPVPVPALRGRYARRLSGIVQACRPAVMMAMDGDRPPAAEEGFGAAALKRVSPPVTDDEAREWKAPTSTADALAFLQYTSGSTGTPKGVMVSHHNLLVNAQRQEAVFALGPQTRCLFWLPLFHDMGLVGGMIQSVFTGYPTLFMSPAAFVERPLRWLEAMSASRATVSGGPNFGYDLVARALESSPPADLDLSEWTVAFCGAEPVRDQTLRRFVTALRPYGFPATAMRPCYGLAEATLLVSAGRWDPEAASAGADGGAAAPHGPARVLLGSPAAGVSIAIVDADTRARVPEGEPGEVWVAGDGVAQGYWGEPDATRETFAARLSDDGGETYLRTGDLGVMRDGQLIILDRLKDVLILRGANHYAHDIEAVVESAHPMVRPHSVAAISVDVDDEERLVVLVEMERGFDPAGAEDVRRRVQLRLAEQCQLTAYDVALVRQGAIPRTSSGKIRRRTCREQYLSNDVHAIGRPAAAPASAVSRGEAVRGILAHALRVNPADVPLDRDIASLGIDSLAVFQVKLAIETMLGTDLAYSALLDMSVRELALAVDAASGRAAPPPAAPLQLGTATDGAPLSLGQRALLYLHNLRPEEHAYAITRVLRFRGSLDLGAFSSAIRELGIRHQALRMTVEVEQGEPRQRFDGRVAVDEHDARGWDDGRLRDELGRLARLPFDLRDGPLVTAHICRVSGTEHVLMFRAHHLAVDLWSLALLLEELEQRYREQKDGATRPSTPVHQYSEFALWQHALVQSDAGRRLADFWQQRLEDHLDALTLPLAPPNPPRPPGAARLPFRLDAETTGMLRRVCRGSGATLNTLVIAACQLLLARLSGQRRFLVGTLASGRTRAAFRDVVGYCVNLIPLRVDLRENMTFERFLAQTRTELIAALDHQDLPFSTMVERLRPQRSGDRSPLIRAVCVCQPSGVDPRRDLRPLVLNRPGDALRFDDLAVEPLELGEIGAQFDLSFVITDGPDGLSGVIQYESSAFTDGDMAAMTDAFGTLLRSIAVQPDRRVGELPLVADEAYRTKSAGWNDTARPFEDTICVHEAIASQAARTPTAVALTHRSTSWTYDELRHRVAACGERLRGIGIGPEVRVAVCVPRSMEMVAAMLGVSAAGGAYVPLDRSHPAERLERIVRAAVPAALVTTRGLAHQLSALDVPLLFIDELCAPDDTPQVEGAGTPGGPSAGASPHPDNALYVMYTSGSTGAPKGVVVSHRNVMNLFAGMDEKVGCGPADTLIAVTSTTFDISVVELLWTLARGARVVIADEPGAPRPAPRRQARPLALSLFYFADADTGRREGRYELLLEGAKYADRHGFAAVWTPERHFHPFGGLYPNPSVTSAALATITSRISLRAGSVVLPLHHPIRVAEEWALVDNLSNGRVGVAFASGWHAEDFAFAPEDYENRKAIMLEGIETVRALWRGEALEVRAGNGQTRRVQLYPRPMQPALPMWLTAAGAPETFGHAARLSANVLTHLLGQSIEALGEKVALYTGALRAEGRDPQAFDVTLMLHAYVDETAGQVVTHALEPFKQYLRSSLDLVGRLIKTLNLDLDMDRMTPTDLDDLIAFAAERYMGTSGLFGTPRECLDILDRLVETGVTEVACLVDFGVERGASMAGIERLAAVRDRFNAPADATDRSVPALAAGAGGTMIQCTPSMLAMMLRTDPVRARFGGLRAVLLGGEPLPIGLVAELGFPANCMNMYGPTETTVWSAAAATPRGLDRVTIGGPLANTQLHVLDPAMGPLPEGAVGEVWIGGLGVARGYWQEPALTATRFLPDPFSTTPGARLYQTGDVGRSLRDGSIELLGRSDQQVKLRGYRVELGDVEATLNAVAGVRAAVAIKHQDENRGDELVAYVVADDPQQFDPDRVRAAVQATLPGYMVPSLILPIDSLPVTPNHKVDRQRLARLAISPTSGRRVIVEPGTELEARVRQIWRDVLGSAALSVDDNFFDVGGHSLLIADVHARLQQELGRTFALLNLLERPTIRGIADFLERGAPTAAIDPSGRAADQRRAFQAHRHLAAQADAARSNPA